MDFNKINISKIETFLNSKFDNVVSNNTFFGGKRPEKSEIPTDWNDMVFVDIPNGISDFDAYGRGSVFVYLCARPMSSGRKNVPALSNLEAKLNEVIQNNADSTYYIKRRLNASGYDTTIGWHYNVVELVITVF